MTTISYIQDHQPTENAEAALKALAERSLKTLVEEQDAEAALKALVEGLDTDRPQLRALIDQALSEARWSGYADGWRDGRKELGPTTCVVCKLRDAA